MTHEAPMDDSLGTNGCIRLKSTWRTAQAHPQKDIVGAAQDDRVCPLGNWGFELGPEHVSHHRTTNLHKSKRGASSVLDRCKESEA
jgi:hypothetical protein